jgi:hypothetical protein
VLGALLRASNSVLEARHSFSIPGKGLLPAEPGITSAPRGVLRLASCVDDRLFNLILILG